MINFNTKRFILVTGGAGFIGSNFILDWIEAHQSKVVNLDLLTYAGNISNLSSLSDNASHVFVKGNIGDIDLVTSLLKQHQPMAVVNFAAETHVDRSIANSNQFIHTNINGTYTLLEAARSYWETLPSTEKENFRFLHVSTDEIYGSLDLDEPAFTEEHPCKPNSPYSASKASSDHLVRAWHHTYGLPTIITNCSNNYGPYQFPEKLIPLMITNALSGKILPIYGNGQNIRDWLFVKDHCTAIGEVLKRGRIGESYNVGGNNEKTNLDVVHTICTLLDQLAPPDQRNIKSSVNNQHITSYSELISFVQDRPGHDRRYAIDTTKIERELGWYATETFETGIAKTIKWYLDNESWVYKIIDGEYKNWLNQQYGRWAA